ncbi:MAG: hypothetical protein M1829_001818 [Trizodia sp. TS-e1964]|nr:MAG: hypothetical protein M1829_001818 [Trizodia sp. TS-e1964]
MTRVYGNHPCNICHKVPVIGWVYQCTQDEHKVVDPIIMKIARPSGAALPASSVLSPRVLQDYINGHYTEKQLEILIAQKQKVNKAVENALKLSVENYHRTSYGNLQLSTVSDFDLSESLAMNACKWKCCAHCRPSCTDRAWERIDSVLPGSNRQVIDSELRQPRPISNAMIVRNIGLREPSFTTTSINHSLQVREEEQDAGLETAGASVGYETPVKKTTFRALVKRFTKKIWIGRKHQAETPLVNLVPALTLNSLFESFGDVAFNQLLSGSAANEEKDDVNVNLAFALELSLEDAAGGDKNGTGDSDVAPTAQV